MSNKYVADDGSENGSEDTSCALSEVSCDDAAPRFYSRVSTTVPTNILENVQFSSLARTVLAEVPESDPRSNRIVNGNLLQNKVSSAKEIGITAAGGNSNVPKGGMLDTTSSNAVSNMLLSAKQKTAERDNDSDDDWG